MSVPDYRKIEGARIWSPNGSLYDSIEWNSEEMVYGSDETLYAEELDILKVREGIKNVFK